VTPRRRPQPPEGWEGWVADNMQQHERELSPFERSTPSALILVPLLGLPALLIVGVLVAILLK
jgi:hypothetical protein